MEDFITKESDEMQVLLTALGDIRSRVQKTSETHRPIFNGEQYLTSREVCERLSISLRTLQEYRDRQILPYTQFGGKILYKVSDIEKMLEDNYIR